jgi:hypothetical protein
MQVFVQQQHRRGLNAAQGSVEYKNQIVGNQYFCTVVIKRTEDYCVPRAFFLWRV